MFGSLGELTVTDTEKAEYNHFVDTNIFTGKVILVFRLTNG